MTTPQATSTTYVCYLYPGSLFDNESTKVVDVRNPEQEAKNLPSNAFAFFYIDVVKSIVEVEGEFIETTSGRRNISKKYYVDADLLDYAAVEALFIADARHDTLLSNMRGNGTEYVLRCRTGNFQEYKPSEHELLTSVG